LGDSRTTTCVLASSHNRIRRSALPVPEARSLICQLQLQIYMNPGYG
jgi:hypothetical protein